MKPQTMLKVGRFGSRGENSASPRDTAIEPLPVKINSHLQVT